VQPLSREEIEKQSGDYDEYGFFVLEKGDFYDPNGYYFDENGYDGFGGYYDDNMVYVPAPEFAEEYYKKYQETYDYGYDNEYDMEDYFAELCSSEDEYEDDDANKHEND
jgi:hypothetical protein